MRQNTAVTGQKTQNTTSRDCDDYLLIQNITKMPYCGTIQLPSFGLVVLQASTTCQIELKEFCHE